MHRYWQKEALLVRRAMPKFEGALDRDDVFTLAMRDDVESRLVQKQRGGWSLAHGPFSRATLRALPPRQWTLLVQGVNLHVPAADALLRRFAFLPYARLDDVMVSYAAPGGGVGSHLDAYDVFLLQGFGRRRWRYGRQHDHAFRRGVPLKILRRFTPSDDAVLEPGDMLYLPPHYAHDGIAIDACTTYSIGFRAPSANELAQAFLDFLHDHVTLEGQYRDPTLLPTTEPARIGQGMQRQIERMLREVRWQRDDVQRFLGTWLSEPKASVFFEPPRRVSSRRAFQDRARRDGVHLDRRAQLLYDDTHIFINGSAIARGTSDAAIVALANSRALPGGTLAAATPAEISLFHEWYGHGYLGIGATPAA